MDPSLLAQACDLYQTSAEVLTPLSGGHYNAVYRFSLPKTKWTNLSDDATKYGVLRLGVEDCPTEQTLGMLDWVHFLSVNGAPVAAPIPSIHGRLLERLQYQGTRYTCTAFEEASGILAERIPPQDWTDELFQSIGRAAGKMHAVSKSYHPSSPSLQRPQWYESYEIYDAMENLASTDPAREKLVTLIKELRDLPSSSDDFGLIHDDLHFANFLIQPGGDVKIIDFDDCVYGWFAMDVAMAVFDILVLHHAEQAEDEQEFTRRYLFHYLKGYRLENELDAYGLKQMPQFLKLKELCVYAPLVGHQDVSLPDSWVGRFMQGRAERIANDVPYVDIDFINL